MIRMRFTTFPLVTKISPTSSSSAASPYRMSARLRAFWCVCNGEGVDVGETRCRGGGGRAYIGCLRSSIQLYEYYYHKWRSEEVKSSQVHPGN